MSHSWRSVDTSAGRLQELSAGNVTDPRSGYRYSVSTAGGRISVEETVLDPRLRWTKGRREEAAYLIGSGCHATALASHVGNEVRLLPVAHFTAEDRWRMSPGYEAQNVRFSRPVTEACIACHASDARLLAPTINAYAGPIASGISCRRCHGPADDHVAQMRSGRTNPGRDQLPDDHLDLVNPARLDAPRANDVCLQCHLQGIVAMYPAGRGPFTYRPGDVLADHRHDFVVDTKSPASFGVASHGSRMMESRCYQASGGELTCIHCHDPHRPVADFSAADFDAKCLTCHGDVSRLPADRDHQSAAGCTSCHMPQRSTREGQHLLFTDHWIRRQPEPFEPEPAELKAGAKLRYISTAAQVDESAKLGAALVWLHEAIGPQPELLAQGVDRLRPLVESGRGDAEDAYWLGAGLLHRGQARESEQVLRRLLELHPDHQRARYQRALVLRKLGNLRLADTELSEALRQAPHWPQPAEALAMAQLQQRAYESAAATLEKQLEHGESATAMIHLAVSLIESSGDLTQAETLLNRAAELHPLDPTVQLNLAYLNTRRSNLTQAAVHYRRVLALDPSNGQARQALEAIERP
jgi:Flp pilus assembly protein TadD